MTWLCQIKLRRILLWRVFAQGSTSGIACCGGLSLQLYAIKCHLFGFVDQPGSLSNQLSLLVPSDICMGIRFVKPARYATVRALWR